MKCKDCKKILKGKFAKRCNSCANRISTKLRHETKPFGFIKGMRIRLGKKFSKSTLKRMSEKRKGVNAEEKSRWWKGDKVQYRGLHNWIERKCGKPTKCEHCGKDGLTGHKIHWANKSGKYLRKLSDWLRLCAKCHKQYDH